MNNFDNPDNYIFKIIYLILLVFLIIAHWKIFIKAGKPGWWLVLYFVPIVNVVINMLVHLGIAKAFGRSTLFGILGLWLFSFIGFAIIAFGSDQYIGAEKSSSSEQLLSRVDFSVPQSPQLSAPAASKQTQQQIPQEFPPVSQMSFQPNDSPQNPPQTQAS